MHYKLALTTNILLPKFSAVLTRVLSYQKVRSLVPRPLSTPISRFCIKSVHRGLGTSLESTRYEVELRLGTCKVQKGTYCVQLGGTLRYI
jgi:hypothetical protein